MKGGLEHADEPGVGQHALHDPDRVQIRPVMERRQTDPVLHALHHLRRQFVDAEVALGQGGLEAHPLYFGDRAERSHPLVRQAGEELADAHLVGGDILTIEVRPGPCILVAVAEQGVVPGPHPLHGPPGQNLALGHVVHLEFQGGASHVAGQYDHRFTSPAAR